MAGFEYNPLIPLNLQKRAKEVDPSLFATAEQGELADSALQTIAKGTDSNYITTTVTEKNDNKQSISSSLTLCTIESVQQGMDGIATAKNVRDAIDTVINYSFISGTKTAITNNAGLLDMDVASNQYAMMILGVKNEQTLEKYYGLPIGYDKELYVLVTDVNGNKVLNTSCTVDFRYIKKQFPFG